MKRQNLVELRNQYNLTQKDLAQKLGLSAITVRKIENNNRNPSIDMTKKFCVFFDKELDEVFPDIFLTNKDT